MKISKEESKKFYSESPNWLQEKMENEFGKEFFKSNEFELIKTFEDACTKQGINPEDIVLDSDSLDEASYKKLKVIVKAINPTDWAPNWNNSNQKKWWPWFLLSSGFGFSCSLCAYDYSFTCVGSRLCFASKEMSNYAATQFIDIYKEFLTIKK